MFSGSMVALVTPMEQNGDIDYNSLTNLLDFHLEHKTDALITVATTGEGASLSHDEKISVVKFILDYVKGKIPVLAATNENGTKKTAELTKVMMDLGVDGCLISTPAYIKPMQEGLVEHYKYIASEVSVPIIAYNVPSRTCCDLLPETLEKLADIPNIVGIKEASGHLDRVTQIRELCQDRLTILSGDDSMTLDMMLLGAKGTISVSANVVPHMVKEMCDQVLKNNTDRAKQINNQLVELNKALFVETNPIPVKWILAKMNLISDGIRLPLTKMSNVYENRLIDAMKAANITN